MWVLKANPKITSEFFFLCRHKFDRYALGSKHVCVTLFPCISYIEDLNFNRELF